MFSYITTTFTTATGVQISVGNTTKHLSSSFFSPHPYFTSKPLRSTAIRAVIPSSATGNYYVLPEDNSLTKGDNDDDEEYPSGEFKFKKPGAWDTFAVKLRMLIAFPWQRVCKGSVLELDLRGQISDRVESSFSSGLSLPQICENLIKAAYDPRISGVYLQFETLECGWGILEEIRRHILDFRKSGKFVVGYATEWHEKEYYLGCACDELYTPPSAYFSLYGLSLQAQFYGGKKKEEIESLINEGVYQIVLRMMVTSIMKRKMGISLFKILHVFGYNKYSRVMKWTLGLSGGDDEIAVIRASGNISRVRGPFVFSNSGIIAEQFIEKIHTARESRYNSVIIRIDSPGGDALASDLMWREIKLLAEKKPVVASMVYVAASGGYYMAMAAQTIVSDNLTLTGFIGVVTGKFNLEKLYERIGSNKESISKGRFAELYAADQRPFRREPDEEKLFAENAYKKFRDKAAYSRSMSMKWRRLLKGEYGLVTVLLPGDKKVTLVELSESSPSLPEILSSIGDLVIGLDTTLKQLQESVRSSGGVQVLMDEIMF